MDESPSLPATSPAAPELLEPGDYTQYLLRTQNEITFVLRSLLDGAARITVYFNNGRDFLLTTLIALEDDRILFDYGSDAEMNRKALAADKLFCATQHEKVRIQFILRSLRETSHGGRPAFVAAFPDTLLRLQRREFFRLTVPVARPLRCVVPCIKADGSRAQIEIHVVDISGGGMAVMAPPDGMGFEPGAEFPNCRLELPEVGIIAATIRICNVFEVTLRNGSVVKRAGCEFMHLPGAMMTLVQRYIIKVERERKARAAGLK